MGAKALAAYAASNFGVALTEAEAATHRDAFFRTYPGLRDWHRSVPNGTLQTRTLAGRRRVGVSAFTEKLNTPTQGTGADGLKRALALLWERRTACPDTFPVLLVHDEIVVECDETKQNEAMAWVRDATRDGMAPLLDPVPVEVELSAGRTGAGNHPGDGCRVTTACVEGLPTHARRWRYFPAGWNDLALAGVVT
jgi:DNA polymerase-1